MATRVGFEGMTEQELLGLGQQLAQAFEQQLLAGQLGSPVTAAERQFQLQMLGQLAQQDPARFAQPAMQQFQQAVPQGGFMTPETAQAMRGFAATMAPHVGSEAAFGMLPQLANPNLDQQMQQIAARGAIAREFGGALTPGGIQQDPRVLMGLVSGVGTMQQQLQALVDRFEELVSRAGGGGTTGATGGGTATAAPAAPAATGGGAELRLQSPLARRGLGRG